MPMRLRQGGTRSKPQVPDQRAPCSQDAKMRVERVNEMSTLSSANESVTY